SGYFGSYEEAASDPRVDALYFFTPHNLHLENALLAARHSKHILMEKPLALTIDESTEMMKAASDAGVKLMVAENYRFLPAVQKCKDIIKQGYIGNLRLIQIQAESYRAATNWRTSAEIVGGGSFIDGGIHYIDVLVNLGGFPDRVYAVKPPQVFRNVGGEDGMVLVAHLSDGGVGLINYSTATASTKENHLINVTGTKGFLSFTPYGNEMLLDTQDVRRTIRLPEARRGVRSMLREFRDSIAEDREPLMSGKEGLQDLAVVLGAYESADQGREVSLTQPSP
ncbi:MAG: Gfo/Idh/MocA family oxidoreductase, partial [Chloroflexi bacterium]|nr:Gfo/Idh/MocA family oxidoreductase [Chloroflexota bacterium]